VPLRQINFLRWCHLGLALGAALAAPFADSDSLVLSAVIPALMPVFFFTLPLDITMCWVKKNEPLGRENERRHRFLIRANCIALLILLLAWLPFFMRLLPG